MAISAASLVVDVSVDGLSEAQRGIDSFGKTIDNVGRGMTSVGAGITGAITAPILALGKSAITSAADYQSGMNMMQAVTGATAAEMDRAGDIAKQLGSDITLPGTSASDASQAMVELGKAGIDLNDIFSGTRGVLELSAAGNLSNAQAAEIAANALNSFNLAGSETSRVADLLAAAANASSAEVVDVAASLTQVSAVAAAAGIPIEQVVAAIAELANAGIKGSDAGTSLRSMFQKLQAPTDEARELMGELGIKIYDAAGAMLPFEQIITNVQGALVGLTQEQRDAAMASIFGADAIRAANIVIMGGVDAFNEMESAVTKTGAAQELAAARTRGLAGAWDGFRSTVETALLSAADPMLGFFEQIVNRASAVIEWVSGLDRSILIAAGAFVGLVAAIGPVVAAIGLFISVVNPVTLIIGGIVVAIAALGAAAVLAAQHWDAITTAFPEVGILADALGESFDRLLRIATLAFPAIADIALGSMKVIIGALQGAVGALFGVGMGFRAIVDRDYGALQAASDYTAASLQRGADSILEGYGQMEEGVGDAIQAIINGWNNVSNTFDPAAVAMETRINANKEAQAAWNARMLEFEETGFPQAVAEAASSVDLMADATMKAWNAQHQLNGIMDVAQERVGIWEGHLSDAEAALKILDGEMAEHGSLTAEQQRQYDTLTWAVGRYQGGIEDNEGAVVSAAEAQANFIRIQDELNGKLATGEITQQDYNREMSQAAGAIDPATGAAFGLAGAQGDLMLAIDGVVNKLRDMLIELGLIPPDKKTEVSAPGAPEAYQQLSDVKLAADNVPRSMTIDVHANIAQAVSALNDLRGMTYTESPPKEGPMAFQPDFEYIFESLVPAARTHGTRAMEMLASYLPMSMAASGPLTRPVSWDWLFTGLDKEAEDFAAKAAEAVAGFITGLDMTDLASGGLLADAEAALGDLINARKIAEEMRLGDEIIAAIQRQIDAAQAEVDAIGAAMGTDIVKAIGDALASGELAAELADFREQVIGGINLDSIADDMSGLKDTIANLGALHDAALALGDTETAARLAAQIAELQAELALMAQVLNTDVAQAWIANQDAMAAAEEAAEEFKQKIEALNQSYYDLITGISQGGDATASFITDLVANAEQAEQALNWGTLLGLPDEVLAQLQADFDKAAGLLETGSVYLVKALEAGLIDEATLRSLAEAGGEWFQALYDSLFGPGALAELEAGWNDISDASLAALSDVIGQMEDGGAEIIDTLVNAITTGAMSFEEGLGLLGDATGEEVNAIIAELERLQTALIVQLAEALATGSDPSEIEANLQVIEQLLASLAGQAVETTVALQGMSIGVGGSGSAVTGLEALEDAIRQADEAARELAAAPIVEAWEQGKLTTEAAAEALRNLGKELDTVTRATEDANGAAERYQRTVERFSQWDTALFNFHIIDRFGQEIDGQIERLQQAFALDPESFTESFVGVYEQAIENAQKALLSKQEGWINSTQRVLEEMKRLAGILGIDIGKALTDGVEAGMGNAAKSPIRGDFIKDPTTGILRPATAKELAMYAPPPPPPIGAGATSPMSVTTSLSQTDMDILAAKVGKEVNKGAQLGLIAGWRDVQTGARPVTGLVG